MGGLPQNLITVFENSVIRPVFTKYNFDFVNFKKLKKLSYMAKLISIILNMRAPI